MSLAELEDFQERFRALRASLREGDQAHWESNPKEWMGQVLLIARQDPRKAAILVATVAYLSKKAKVDDPIVIANPWKRPLFNFFAKPVRFSNINDLISVIEIGITQKVNEPRAMGIASVAFLYSNIEDMLKEKMTMAELKAAGEVAAWEAHQAQRELIKIVGELGRLPR